MKTTTVRISQEKIDLASNLYESRQGSIEKIIDGYSLIRSRVLESFKGHFKENELTALITCFNGTLISSNMQTANVLLAQVEDAEKYEGACSNHDTSSEIIKEKINKLDFCQIFFLIDEIYRFWNVGLAYGSPNPNLRQFHKKFIDE